MAMFLLAGELEHDKAVRGVGSFPSIPGGVLTASFDKLARIWIPGSPLYETVGSFVGHAGEVTSIGFIPPTGTGSSAHIVTTAWDNKVIIWSVDTFCPVHVLSSHEDKVCAVHVASSGSPFITGSWDKTAIIWKWAGGAVEPTSLRLRGHQASVLCVLCLNDGTFLTGSGDRSIMHWSSAGVRIHHLTDSHSDSVQGFTELPQGFASCANDFTIVIWSADCVRQSVLLGHTGLVYAVAYLHDSLELVSVSEDKTMRIWQDGMCIQTVAHPTILRDVAVLPSGDVVTAGEDRYARVFTRVPERSAPEAIQTAFKQKIENQKVAKQQIGSVDLATLEGPTALQVPGATDGQTKIINNNGVAEVYSWNSTQMQWDKVGEVVDDPSSEKQLLHGVPYDYVFAIELQERKFQLGYNKTENPFVAANRFIEQHREDGVDERFLDDIAAFIAQNSDQSHVQSVNPDRLTSGSSYRAEGMDVDQLLQNVAGPESSTFSAYAREAAALRAAGSSTGSSEGNFSAYAREAARLGQQGNTNVPASSAPVAFSKFAQEALRAQQEANAQQFGSGSSLATSTGSSKDLPVRTYLRFDAPANADGIKKKLTEFNAAVDSSSKLSDTELAMPFGTVPSSSPGVLAMIDAVSKILTWPKANRFPAVDALRILILHDSTAPVLASQLSSVAEQSPLGQVLRLLGASDNNAEVMLCVRCVANAIASPATRTAVLSSVTLLTEELLPYWKSVLKTEHLQSRLALASVLLNISVYSTLALEGRAFGPALIPFLTDFLLGEPSPQVLMLILQAVGTLLYSTSPTRTEALAMAKESLLAECLGGRMMAPGCDPEVALFSQAVRILLPQ